LFESVAEVDDKGLRRLPRATSSEVPLVALKVKGADPVIRERFFKNMSKRAAQMLREGWQLLGPVRRWRLGRGVPAAALVPTSRPRSRKDQPLATRAVRPVRVWIRRSSASGRR